MTNLEFSELLTGRRAGRRKLTSEQREALHMWREGPGPWPFLTGTWPLRTRTGSKGSREPKPLVWTQDPFEKKVRPFPNYEYLRSGIVERIFRPPLESARLRYVLDKPRQVLATTGIVLSIAWEVLFREATQWLIAKNKREEAEDLIVEKMRFAYERLPLWLRQRRVVRPIPKGRFLCKQTGSVAKAVGQNFGRSEAKGSTADVFIDEAVLLRDLKSAWEAADAMAARIAGVATPPEDGQASPESVLFFRELLEGRTAGELTSVAVGAPDDDDDALDDEEAAELLGVAH